MLNLSIRRISSEDAFAVSDIIRRNFLEVNIKDYPEEEMKRAAEIYTPEKIQDMSRCTNMYVACLDDKVVGCGAISEFWGRKDESVFLTIFVLPELQGKGIGRQIVEALEQDELFLRSKRIEISSTTTACDFYLKLGYEYKDGIRKLDSEGQYRLEKYRDETGEL